MTDELVEAAAEPRAGSRGLDRVIELARDRRLWVVVAMIGVLVVAVALRAYRMPELLVLGNDQGRDALVVDHMLRTGEPVLEGPIASIGTYHRGPAYYYLLAPAYWFSGGHPIGGAVLTVILEVASITITFFLVRALAGTPAGLIAAGLWAVSPMLVSFGRSQWNPQAMLPFALLSMYAVLHIARGDGRWLLVLVPAWLIAWQMHDPALLLLPMLAVLLIWRWRVWLRPRLIVGAAGLGLAVLLPFIYQQLTHRFGDVRAMLDYLLSGVTGAGPPPAVPSLIDRVTTAIGWLKRALPGPDAVDVAIVGLALFGLCWAAWRSRRGPTPETAVLLLFAATPLLYAFWRAPFHGHYMLLIQSLPLILAGVGMAAIIRVSPRVLGPPAALGLVVVIAMTASGSLANVAALTPPPRRWDNKLLVVHQIIDDAAGQPFAFRLFSDQEPLDGWRSPWDYAFRYAMTQPDARRVDLLTYVVFEPADFANGTAYGGNLVEDLGWAGFPVPQFGENLLSGDWQFAEFGSGALENDQTGVAIRLTAASPPGLMEASHKLAVVSDRRYLIRFDHRTDETVANAAVYMQLFDAAGQLLTTLPNGGGYRRGRSADWTTGSFIGEAPFGTSSARLIVRAVGTGTAWFRNVEVREVIADAAPW